MIYTTKTHFIGRFMLWINWELVTWIWLLITGISAAFMQIDGPSICAIMYKAYEENPREGSWNMRGKVIWRGAKISSWAVINFSKYVPPQAVQTFSSKLPELCNTYGVRMNPDLAAPPATEINGNVEGVLKHVIDSAERNGNPLELILCIMPQQENKHLYATVKRLCELEFGVWTQCCLADHVKKCRPDYIANVILKINAKAWWAELIVG